MRVETWSRQGERAQAEQWEDEQNPCCGKKDSNLEIKGCFLSAAAMFYTVCLHSGSVFPVEIHCEILMRTEGTGAVAVRQHHFNNEQILDQANNFVG